MTEADTLPTASDHADTYDPTTDLCANWMCARCRHIRAEREGQR